MSGRSKLAAVLAISALVAAPTATASAATEPAGPALAKLATVLGAGHAQVFAQDVDQQAVIAFQGDFDRVAVQGETDQHPAWAPPGCPRY